jgi:hypothetical protein
MKRFVLAALLLFTLCAGNSFADDPWGPKAPCPQPGTHSLTTTIYQMWEKLLSYI